MVLVIGASFCIGVVAGMVIFAGVLAMAFSAADRLGQLELDEA